MKLKYLSWVLGVLLFSWPVMAQSGSTASSGSGIQPTVTTLAVMGKFGSKLEAGTDAVGTLQITPKYAVRTDNVEFPTPGISADTAGVDYSGTFKNSRLSYDLNGGVGMISSPQPMHFAANVGGALNFQPKGEPKITIQLVNVEYWHGGVADGTTQTSNWFTVASGIQLNLGKIF